MGDAKPVRTLPASAVFTRAELRAHGWTDQSISRAERADRLHRVRHGVLAAIPVTPELTAAPYGTGHLMDALLHRATLPAEDTVDIAGCPVTSVPRTLVDDARSRPITCAVAAMDAALHREMTTMDEIEQVLIACWNWPGIGRALRAVRFVDARADSPLESVSRLVIGWLHLPAPQPQVLVLDERGIVLARLDFYWDDVGVAGEADGRAKYDDRTVLTDEKDRQEAVEDLGIPFARWGWRQTTRPQLLRSKITRTFERGRARDRSGLRRGWSIVPTWTGHLERKPDPRRTAERPVRAVRPRAWP